MNKRQQSLSEAAGSAQKRNRQELGRFSNGIPKGIPIKILTEYKR
jgi:hypothetical protein